MPISYDVPGLTKELQEIVAGSGRYTLLAMFRKMHKQVRMAHKMRIESHTSPEGSPWAKAKWSKYKPFPIPQMGDKAGIIRLNEGNGLTPIFGGQAAVAFGKINSLGRLERSRRKTDEANAKNETQSVDAIYRPTGEASTQGKAARWKSIKRGEKIQVVAAGRLHYMMTVDKAVGSAGGPSNRGLLYGLNNANTWASIHQYGGGRYAGKAVPVRQFIGLNDADIVALTRIMDDFYRRALEKGGSSGVA